MKPFQQSFCTMSYLFNAGIKTKEENPNGA
jgi:hypothetical protein